MPIMLDCEQGSAEWLLARSGIPTASEFEAIVATKRDGTKKAEYKNLLYRLVGERITGEVAEPVTSEYIRRGHRLEAQARESYALINDVEPQVAGFILSNDKQKGFSPDALIGDDGILEIKTKKPEFLIECIEKGDFPEDHKAQCQGGLWITEREWVDIMVYWPNLPPYIKRSYRDEAYINELSKEVDIFNEQLLQLIEKVSNFNSYSDLEAA